MSPPGCQKMSAKPCNRNAAESFPVLSLKSREQKPPNPLLIQDKNVLQPRATPTPVDFKELYTALQQGLVDGQENPPGTIVDVKLYKVQKYMTESHHGFLHY